MQQRASLQLRQSQSLVMTQQLQQSIKLLQLNSLELMEFIEQEIEKNPLLSISEEVPGNSSEDNAEEERIAAQNSSVAEDDYADAPEADVEPVSPAMDTFEADVPDIYADISPTQGDAWEYDVGERIRIAARTKEGELFEDDDTRPHNITLREHLLAQLVLEFPEGLERHIGARLIDLVDEAGYITEDIAQLANQLGIESAKVEAVLRRLQRFDPPGVCARNLAECLTAQLRDRDRFDPAMETMMGGLPLLAAGHLDTLKRQCGVDMDDLKDMIAEIRRLNPKPGLSFVHEVVQIAEPDVIVERDAKGNWKVELNTRTLPRVLVDRRYYATISAQGKGEDKKYLSEQLATANWLMKALDQRANTILKVSTEIVSQQNAFFRMGIHHLRPLTLKDIAQETGYHESTVSRVTTGKFMMTPRGLFELKYFFTSGVQHGAGGDSVSSQTVKHVIKQLIDKEEAGQVLSDDDIVEKLTAQNIEVARRTVAKYREALGIPSSVQRRRMKLTLS